MPPNRPPDCHCAATFCLACNSAVSCSAACNSIRFFFCFNTLAWLWFLFRYGLKSGTIAKNASKWISSTTSKRTVSETTRALPARGFRRNNATSPNHGRSMFGVIELTTRELPNFEEPLLWISTWPSDTM